MILNGAKWVLECEMAFMKDFEGGFSVACLGSEDGVGDEIWGAEEGDVSRHYVDKNESDGPWRH